MTTNDPNTPSPGEPCEMDPFFELTSHLLCVAGVDGFFKRLNPAWERTLGIPTAELLSRPWIDFVHPGDRERTITEGRKLFEGSWETVGFENRYRCADGSYCWLEWNVRSFREQGLIYGIAQDVTERRRAEEERRRGATFLDAVLDSIDSGIVACDTEGKIVLFNQAMRRLHGGGPHVVAPEDWADHFGFYRPDGKTGLMLAEFPLYRAWLGERFRNVEVRFTSEGTPRVGIVSGQPFVDSEGRRLGAVIAVRDITELRAAEDAARAGGERLQLVARATNDAIYDWDLRADRCWLSDGMKETFGHPETEIAPALTWWEGKVHPEDLERLTAATHDALEHHRPAWVVEYRFRKADGSWADVLDRARILYDAEGTPLRWVGAIIDMTEHKRLEAQFRQAQKMEALGQLAGGVAHDFNNFLMVVTGYSDLLLRRLPPDAAMRKELEEIKAAGDRAARVTRQLLAFSRRQVLSPVALDLNEAIAGMSKMLHRLIGEDLELICLLTPGAGAVRADPGQIEQVVMNLVVNARDATPGGGRITIETRSAEILDPGQDGIPPGRYVTLSVSDTGCGMSPETLSHIFEPFFTTKGPGKGTGLGLSTVLGIVQQSGGHVRARSAPKEGSTFTIWLPRVEAEVSKVAPPEAGSYPGGTETVLVVEDAAPVRKLAREMLQMAGYGVIEAENGQEGLDAARRHPGPIHLALVDAVMPIMGGMEFVKRLPAIRPDTRVLFMSGYVDRDVELLSGAYPLLPKPFTLPALAAKVREALDRPAARSA